MIIINEIKLKLACFFTTGWWIREPSSHSQTKITKRSIERGTKRLDLVIGDVYWKNSNIEAAIVCPDWERASHFEKRSWVETVLNENRFLQKGNRDYA